MSVEIAPFELSDIAKIEVQPQHASIKPMLCRYLLSLSELVGPWSYTAWNQYGLPVASCGILQNGNAWALLSPILRRDMLAVTRYVRGVLEDHTHAIGPVLADIDEKHSEAVRWAKLLGFRPKLEIGVWQFSGSTTR